MARCRLRLAEIARRQGRHGDVEGLAKPGVVLLQRSPLKPDFAGLEVQASLLRELALAKSAVGDESGARTWWQRTAEGYRRALDRIGSPAPPLGAHARALRNLAEALEAVGDGVGAKTAYERYLEIHGDDPPVDAPFVSLVIGRGPEDSER
jgi:hypothetical protein